MSNTGGLRMAGCMHWIRLQRNRKKKGAYNSILSIIGFFGVDAFGCSWGYTGCSPCRDAPGAMYLFIRGWPRVIFSRLVGDLILCLYLYPGVLLLLLFYRWVEKETVCCDLSCIQTTTQPPFYIPIFHNYHNIQYNNNLNGPLATHLVPISIQRLFHLQPSQFLHQHHHHRRMALGLC